METDEKSYFFKFFKPQIIHFLDKLKNFNQYQQKCVNLMDATPEQFAKVNLIFKKKPKNSIRIE